jgi:hypothetical protein
MVMVEVPVEVPEGTVTFIEEVFAVVIGLVENVMVTPDGWPDADNVIEVDELKPFSALALIVEVLELPWLMVSEVGEALSEKSGAVTVRLTVVVAVLLLFVASVPVTVMVYVPAAVDELTTMLIVNVPDAVNEEEGLKFTVTPLGAPLVVKPTVSLKPFGYVAVIVDVPELPTATETELGEALRVKVETVTAATMAVSNAAPLGLPQPLARS